MTETPARARQLRRCRNRERKQRTQNDLGAFVERLLRSLARALRTAGVILDQKLDIGILEFRQRHLGGVLHGLRGDAGIAGGRQRQDQSHLDLPGARNERLLNRSRGTRLRTERIGKRAQALLHARAGPEQGCAEDQANRRPPGCPRRLTLGRQRFGFGRTHHRISSLDRPKSARNFNLQSIRRADSGILSANS